MSFRAPLETIEQGPSRPCTLTRLPQSGPVIVSPMNHDRGAFALPLDPMTNPFGLMRRRSPNRQSGKGPPSPVPSLANLFDWMQRQEFTPSGEPVCATGRTERHP
jgi:hypothetical protein